MARLTMTKEVTQTEIVLAKMRRKEGKSYAEDLPNEILIGNVSFGKAQERMREKYGEGTIVFEVHPQAIVYEMAVEDFIKVATIREVKE